MTAAPWAPQQDYNEEVQEDIYLAVAAEAETLAPQAYSETLQEDIYLGKAEIVVPQLRGRMSLREVRSVSRTPSPMSAMAFLSEATSLVDDDKKVPVKHTFIHYSASDWGDAEPEGSSQGLRKSASAPSILLNMSFQITAVKSMPELHLTGECNPCAYFYHKKDGCRWGGECTFCHECPVDEIKKRKKVKHAVLKMRKLMLEGELAPAAPMKGGMVKEQQWCDLEQDDFE